MSDPTPLGPFLDWLAVEHRYPIAARDRQRVDRLLAEGRHIRDMDTLRVSLAGLLARDSEDFEAFPRHFNAYFDPTARLPLPGEFDLNRFFEALRAPDEKAPEIALRGAHVKAQSHMSAKISMVPAQKVMESFVDDEEPLAVIREVPWPSDVPLADPENAETESQASPQKFWIDDSEHQTFSLGDIGSKAPPLLEEDLLDALAESMGYFSSLTMTHALDVPRTVQASLDRGYPELAFLPGREVCRLLVLEDTESESRAWNTVPRELAEGLAARGVPVTYGLFDGSPALFRCPDGGIQRLEDLDEHRAGLLLLIVTEGGGLFLPARRRLLEELAAWPRIAWLDPREERFWGGGVELARLHGIPVYEASPQGLQSLAGALLTEMSSPAGRRFCSRVSTVEAALGDATTTAWASACAVLPKVSRGIAESLRRRPEFAKTVPPRAWGRLFELPGSGWDGQTLRFSVETREDLQAFLEKRSGLKRDEICRHVEKLLADAEASSLGPENSLARLACEVTRLGLAAQRSDCRAEERDRLAELIGPGSPFAGYWSSDVRGEFAVGPKQTGDRKIPVQSERHVLPEGMVLIPAGSFMMGDPTDEGYSDERPRRSVHVSDFAIHRHPVTWERWRTVWDWAGKNGYDFGDEANGEVEKHPVVSVNWHDAIKWCNALSEMEGRRPAYFTDESQRSVYRRNEIDLDTRSVDWDGEGYRLPTEAEWEKAARGGLEGHHYPWPSKGKGCEKHISSERANYAQSAIKGTTPVGKYPANGFGLHDMAGNVWQWVWDHWDGGWYTNPEAKQQETRGLEEGAFRVIRGGGWIVDARSLRCSCRRWFHPSIRSEFFGFRFALGHGGLERAQTTMGEGRRDDEPSSRRRLRAVGALLTPRVPDVAGMEVKARRLDGLGAQELILQPQQGERMSEGRWEIMTSAPRHETTRTTSHFAAGHAYEAILHLRRELPPGFVWIPGGLFQMGDSTDEGSDNQRPRHGVHVSEFAIHQHAVTWARWREVWEWALERGYTFDGPGESRGDAYPVQSISWHDAVKWCNALSEMESRRPAYYLDVAKREVYRKGSVDPKAKAVEWRGDGYRLPTEAEWEKAARGGVEGHHYPWRSDGLGYRKFISLGLANYNGSQTGGTVPVAQYPPNDFGLHDMAGNIWQWVWDWGDSEWYKKREATEDDTSGPKTGEYRGCRGGSWVDEARFLRCSCRSWAYPSKRYGGLGFRLALGHGQIARASDGSGEARRDDELSQSPEAKRQRSQERTN